MACSTYGEEIGIPGFSGGKNEGKKLPGRPKRRWENIKINLQEVGYKSMDWIDVVQDRGRLRALVNTVMNLRVT